ncbi:hypothetical protein FPV67DRAFT_1455247 [Lyophyllum atratum]|nr:hypothetical protein FPV67DRAFT_1455247 [Lyophyllum atratum]
MSDESDIGPEPHDGPPSCASEDEDQLCPLHFEVHDSSDDEMPCSPPEDGDLLRLLHLAIDASTDEEMRLALRRVGRASAAADPLDSLANLLRYASHSRTRDGLQQTLRSLASVADITGVAWDLKEFYGEQDDCEDLTMNLDDLNCECEQDRGRDSYGLVQHREECWLQPAPEREGAEGFEEDEPDWEEIGEDDCARGQRESQRSPPQAMAYVVHSRATSPLTVESSSVLQTMSARHPAVPASCSSCAGNPSRGPCRFVAWGVTCRCCLFHDEGRKCSFRIPVSARDALAKKISALETIPSSIKALLDKTCSNGKQRELAEERLAAHQHAVHLLDIEVLAIRAADEALCSELVRILDDDLNNEGRLPVDCLATLTQSHRPIPTDGSRTRQSMFERGEYLRGMLEDEDEERATEDLMHDAA